MRQPQFIRSNTFRWTLAVAGVFAVFVILLFGFIYRQTDNYLVARSDKMIASQLNFISGLSSERRLYAIDDHLKQDSRGVQYAGLFGADGGRIAGNLERLPLELKMDDSVQSVPVVKMIPGGRENRVVRAIGRLLPDGDVLVIGLYIYKQLYLTSGLYAFFLAMCIAGLLEWRKATRRAAVVAAA